MSCQSAPGGNSGRKGGVRWLPQFPYMGPSCEYVCHM
ncbi:unnamed protein product, partial [Staurois parvus]